MSLAPSTVMRSAGRRATLLPTVGALCALLLVLTACEATPIPPRSLGIRPEVEVEEVVYRYVPAHNGSDPLWAYGSTVIGRLNGQMVVSGLETLEGVSPYNNVRCQLYTRASGEWGLAWTDGDDRTREPCPLGLLGDGRLVLSGNPTLGGGAEPSGGPAQPLLHEFRLDELTAPAITELPEWEGHPPFTEHSYRGLATDGARQEVLLMNIAGGVAQHWAFRDAAGHWSAAGRLPFPYDRETLRLHRLCYPQLALSDRAAHVMAISDILEPQLEWRRHKLSRDRNAYLYVFRRLYYAWTSDVTATPFTPWVDLANVEETGGSIHNEDLWIDAEGAAHLLWIETNTEPELRDTFFPGTRLTVELVHAIVRDGEMVAREVLVGWQEGQPGDVPLRARFHATCDGSLLVFYASGRVEASTVPGGMALENHLLQVLPGGGVSESVRVPLQRAVSRFQLAAERAGSPCSETIDLVADDSSTIRYVRIALHN